MHTRLVWTFIFLFSFFRQSAKIWLEDFACGSWEWGS
jgi:hypothetical protein